MGLFDSISSGFQAPFKMFNSFMHPEAGYKGAEDAANRNFQEGLQYQAPYAQLGQQQYPQIQAMIQKLLNPGALESQWASGYTESPYAKHELEMNKNAGLDAASSMGLLGSSGALNNIQQGAGNIVQADRQQYMNDLMQKFLTGLGLTSGIYDTGASTASQIGQNFQRQGENMAGLEFGRINSPGTRFANLLKTAATAYGGGGAPGSSGGFAGNTNAFNA